MRRFRDMILGGSCVALASAAWTAAAGFGASAQVPASASPASASPASERVLEVEYTGSFFGLPVMKANTRVALTEDAGAAQYAGTAHFQSAGLAGFFTTSIVDATSAGAWDDGDAVPVSYEHVEIAGKKRREAVMARDADGIAITVTPPFGNLGDPIPSEEQKAEAIDPVAALASLTFAGGGEPCARTVPVFDSRLRYDLEFTALGLEDVRTRGYRGQAHKCQMFYTPIAGFDPSDLENDAAYTTPIYMWLAETAPGVFAPVKIAATFDAGPLRLPVSVQAKVVTVSGAS